MSSSSGNVLTGLLGGVILSAALGYSVAEAVPTRSDLFPLKDVKPGMKGYGLTVMSGTKPEKFDVEIISVLKGFRPNQDLILIKTPNHPRLEIAHTVAGMSGSPIYLEGKMIGAYAYGWTFGAEPIAGVTPIQNMIEDQDKPLPPLFQPRTNLGPAKSSESKRDAAPVRPLARMMPNLLEGEDPMANKAFAYNLKDHAKVLGTRAAKERGTSSTLAPAATPIMIGGMTSSALSEMEAMLAPMGLETLQAGGSSQSVASDAPTAFVDGGAIGVQLVRGDISAMGLGTVTRVEGDKLVAFGHPMMGGGASDMPTAIAQVHWILASSNRSFKIGEAVRPIGTLVNDRQASIVVDSKRTASTFPVRVKIEGVEGAVKTEWNSVCAHDPFMAPMLAAIALGNPLETTTGERGDVTWRTTTTIKVNGYGTITLKDFGANAGDPIGADVYFRSRVVRALGMLLNNPWEQVKIDGVDSTIKISFGRDVSMIRGTQVVDAEIEPGEPVKVRLDLMPYLGKLESRVIEVPIPRSFAGQEVDIDLSPGYENERPRATPESVADLVAALNNPAFPEESIVSTIRIQGESGGAFRGNVATRLPPGAADTLRVMAGSTTPETFSSVEQQAFPMKRFIVGRDRIRVKVRPDIK